MTASPTQTRRIKVQKAYDPLRFFYDYLAELDAAAPSYTPPTAEQVKFTAVLQLQDYLQSLTTNPDMTNRQAIVGATLALIDALQGEENQHFDAHRSTLKEGQLAEFIRVYQLTEHIPALKTLLQNSPRP